MLEKISQAHQARQVQGEVPIYHRYTLGVAGDRFFKAMRDHQQLLASPCPKCQDRLLPPKMYCERCFEETSDDWVPLLGGRKKNQIEPVANSGYAIFNGYAGHLPTPKCAWTAGLYMGFGAV